MMGVGIVGRVGRPGSHTPSQAGGAAATTQLRRESDGTVTVLSLANPYTPIMTRLSDGTVTVGAA